MLPDLHKALGHSDKVYMKRLAILILTFGVLAACGGSSGGVRRGGGGGGYGPGEPAPPGPTMGVSYRVTPGVVASSSGIAMKANLTTVRARTSAPAAGITAEVSIGSPAVTRN